MRVITANVNGIRSAAQKGFFQWLAQQDADVVCLQEVRAHPHQLEDPQFWPAGYHCIYVDAVKKGYSGVAIYSKEKPLEIITQLGYPLSDEEGRYLEIQLPNVSVASLYLPSGTSSPVRQQEKFAFMDFYLKHLENRIKEDKPVIITGDWNIAHTPKDLKNWRGNQKNSGFLPEERAWLDRLFGELNYIDAFREVNQDAEQYTWWSHRGRAWQNNVGWRIDYQILSPSLKGHTKTASIYKAERFSDHAPLIMDYQ